MYTCTYLRAATYVCISGLLIRLGCGTTWHSAGLLGSIRGSRAHSKLTKYSNELYLDFEKRGLGTGMQVCMKLCVCECVLFRYKNWLYEFGYYKWKIDSSKKTTRNRNVCTYVHVTVQSVKLHYWKPRVV